jgi:hypothetical protein
MAPSESAIESAVEALKKSPGTFQRLAEYYAQMVYPKRFPTLIPGGRDKSDVVLKGWPDAYIGDPPDAVEATHSPKWKKHLNDDLRKAEARGPGGLAGFLFVAWAPKPKDELLRPYRDRLVKLGVPTDNITFVFKQQFVRDLRQPRFASVWADLLGLPCSSAPFAPISQAGLFGAGNQFLAPTREEYASGRVHRPSAADKIEESLNSRGWALVRGRGAAGKTVLATQIALNPAICSTAYYLDLARDDVEDHVAIEIITTHADAGVLFVVDNVHLNGALARKLFDQWQSIPKGSRLLMLGRLISATAAQKGAPPLHDLETAAVPLEVEKKDLAGVFSRLARRMVSSPPQPSDEALDEWHRTFAGDLVAFSAAAERRRHELIHGAWGLREEDAAEYVRETYLYPAALEPITEQERRNLLLIGTLATLEIETPLEALETPELHHSIRHGIAHRSEYGREGYVRYRLVHPSLGKLIVKAALTPVDEMQRFCAAASRSAFAGTMIAARLEGAGREQRSAEVLQGILKSPGGLRDSVITPGLQYARTNLERIARLGVLSLTDTDHRLADEYVELAASALRTPLHFLASFLEYAERKLPEVHTTLSRALADPANLKILGETALRTPLHLLASFLEYAERKLPEVHTTLSRALADPANLKILGETALRTPLADLASFLEYAERKLPEVHTTLSRALADPANLKILGETALRTPLADLASFLEYAERKLPEVHTTLSRALADPANLKILGETAVRTPLHFLPSILEYAERKLPDVHAALAGALADPANLKILGETALRAPLDSLLKFLRLGSIADAVLAALDQDRWDKVRGEMKSEQPDYMPELCKQLNRVGRPELAEAPACALIVAAEALHWHSSVIGLRNVSQTLRLGRAAGPDAIFHFLDVVVTEPWLEEQYIDASPGSIAAGLYGLWGYYGQPVLDRFRTQALRNRVAAEIRRAHTAAVPLLSQVLQLLGSSSLLGEDASSTRVVWPNEGRIHEVLEYAAPKADSKEIGYIQAQLWIGLREMARLHADNVRVQTPAGEQILELWVKANPTTDRLKALNTWMIGWLERCRAAGWLLIRDAQHPAKSIRAEDLGIS